MIKEVGSFHIGGRQVSLSGYPVIERVLTAGSAPHVIDPNGDFEVEQMYVQYYRVAERRARYPLLMWHGGGLTGVTWETKPDGQPGWLQYFTAAGHDVYVSDAIERGRAGWARYPEIFPDEPLFRSKREAWELFRIGRPGSYATDPAQRTALPHTKFPLAAFDQFAKQAVPRWACNDAVTQQAYAQLIQRVGDAVVMVHSQGGNFGFRAALAAPDKVKALIAIEPSGAPAPAPELAALRDVPMLIVWGDHLDTHEIWRRQVPALRAFADDVAARGGDVEWLDLAERGIRGNSHMVMMDTNSDEVAALIEDWMKRHGLMV